uniref:Uncharacterized protein n=1 Tax=Ditylenchus dipsaci TaxID=166011 RepID=A0A915E3G5_9BILA
MTVDILKIAANNAIGPVIFALVFGIPSAVLYAMQCYVLVVSRKKRKYSSLFNLLFFEPFVFRMVLIFVVYILEVKDLAELVVKLIISEFTCSIFQISFFVSYYTFHAENVATALYC